MTRSPDTSPLLALVVRRWATSFVQATYHAVLDREADEVGLATYTAELRRTGDFASVFRSIARSPEAWQQSLIGNSTKIVETAFRGLLGRDPEPGALSGYVADLTEHRDVSALLSAISRSPEHWERLLAERAQEVVKATYLGILGREPEAEALCAYSLQLRTTRDLSQMISIIANSHEHWENLLEVKRGASQLLQADNLPSLLSEVVTSQKHWNELLALKFSSQSRAFSAYESDAWIFIHIQKTGGTSLQNMLVDTFGDQFVYREHGDTLFSRSPAELSEYSVFAGHFNYDTVAFIPRRSRRLFTLLREPTQRVLSHYRFLRAHEPSAPDFEPGMEIANCLELADFCRSVFAASTSGFWNHLTWCIMGPRKWTDYRRLMEVPKGDTQAKHLQSIRLEIRTRLHEFEFIGFKEDFDFSCQRLFELIGARVPGMRYDHSVELLSSNLAYFKYVDKHALTENITVALAPLVELDNIVYQEAADIYFRRYGRSNDRGEFRAG